MEFGNLLKNVFASLFLMNLLFFPSSKISYTSKIGLLKNPCIHLTFQIYANGFISFMVQKSINIPVV